MNRFFSALILGFVGIFSGSAVLADTENEMLYRPGAIASGREVSGSLSTADIPTGEGGFAQDYVVNLRETDQVAIDLVSDDFDAMVMLLATDGTKVAENDDGLDGSTNSLLFVRITESGKYIVRVRAFGEAAEGDFSLKVTRLRPIEE